MTKRNKDILLGVLIVGVISMTVAFATLSTYLRINGTANVASTKWNIHFENWTNVTEDVLNGRRNTAEYDDTKIEQTLQPNVTKIDKVNVVLNQPGDYVRYTFDIKNDGTIDAELNNFDRNITCEDNKNCSAINFKVECKDENENNALEENYVLEKDKSVSCVLEVKYNDATNSSIPGQNQKYTQEALIANIGANWTWTQSTIEVKDTFTETETVTETTTETETDTETAEPNLFDFSDGILRGFNPNYPDEYPTDLVIPSQIDGEDVVEIMDYSFENRNIESVTIPNTVTTIGDNAFSGNDIGSLTIPDSVTSIGEEAFNSNPNLTFLTLGNHVQTIGDNAFSHNNIRSLTIPDSVTSIGEEAFSNNYMESLTLGNHVQTIERYAFSHNQIRSVAIPNSVTEIGANAFYYGFYEYMDIYIYNKTNIAFDWCDIISTEPWEVDVTGISYACEVKSGLFENPYSSGYKIIITNADGSVDNIGPTEQSPYTCGEFFFKDGTIYGFSNCKSDSVPSNLVIPSQIDGQTVTAIADWAFMDKTNISSLTLPNTITTIGDGAFSGTSIETVTIPDSVTSIGDKAFQNNQIQSLTLGNRVQTIGEDAFNSNSLETVTIPDSVTSLGDYAFSYNSIKTLTIPDSITTVPDFAFYYNELDSLNLPNTITTIGDGAFSNNSIKTLTIPNSVITIDEGAFYYNYMESLTLGDHVQTIGDNAFSYNNIESLTIPDSVITIGDYAFYSSVSSLTLGSNVQTIGIGAFSSSNIGTLIIPDSVTTIGENAFMSCYIGSLTLGSNVQTIGAGAFSDNHIETVTIPNSVTTIGKNAFSNNHSLTNISNSSLINIYNTGNKQFNWCEILNKKASNIVISDTNSCDFRKGKIGTTVIKASSSEKLKCEEGILISNTNWCLTNPGASLSEQKFEYWTGLTTRVESGWHELTDLYGGTQEYYFENGTAHVGWLEYNGNNYLLSNFDSDGNGYVNCNLIKNAVMEIDGQCYEFSSTGIATPSNSCN